MSKRFNRRMRTFAWLAGAGALMVTASAFAQNAESAKDNAVTPAAAAKAAVVVPQTASIAKGTPRGPGSLAGVWRLVGGASKGPVRTAEGGAVPVQPAVMAVLQKRARDAAAGHPYLSSRARCLPAGPPTLMATTKLMKIIEEPTVVDVLIEDYNLSRELRLNSKFNDDFSPSYMGDSRGHWEGDTLVVETKNFNDDVDVAGMPHSDALKVTERFHRVSKDRLELDTSFEDPKTFTKPWNAPKLIYELTPGGRLTESLCQNNPNGTAPAKS